MESSVLSFLKAEWKVSDTGSAHWASSFIYVTIMTNYIQTFSICDMRLKSSLLLLRNYMPYNMFYLTQFWFCYWTEFACTKVGEQEDFINTVLTAILQTPQYVPQDLRYDVLILVSINTHIYIYIYTAIRVKCYTSLKFYKTK